MKKRELKSEQDFINGATSIAITKPARQKKYKAISVSLTEDHIEKVDEMILYAAQNGIMRLTRSDVIKKAIDKLKKEYLLT